MIKTSSMSSSRFQKRSYVALMYVRSTELRCCFAHSIPIAASDESHIYAVPRTTSLYGVLCRCSCSLIVKEELNIFSLGLSPNLEAEEKMWWGVGRGLDSAMRSRDDLRRRARALFPGQRRPRGEPTNE